MRTITFYSYKGGVGRTLALANLARYLASFGQRVFALDLDLEAPGLHYKLASPAEQKAIRGGVVDVLHALLRGAITDEAAGAPSIAPESMRDFVTRVDHLTDTGGSIHLMAAGHVPSAAYWRKLAQVSFHDLFYAEGARGIPFFFCRVDMAGNITKRHSATRLQFARFGGACPLWHVHEAVAIPDRILVQHAETPDGVRYVSMATQGWGSLVDFVRRGGPAERAPEELEAETAAPEELEAETAAALEILAAWRRKISK